MEKGASDDVGMFSRCGKMLEYFFHEWFAGVVAL